MKKLIVVILATLMAVFAEASSVKWAYAADKSYAGYTVYICADIAEGGFKDVADIQSHLLGSGANSGTLAGTRSATATGTATVDAEAGSTVNFYYVLVNPNDSTGYWTKASSGEAYTTSSTHTDSSIPSADGTAVLAATKTAWATGGGGQGGETVPEPTSGLLLLVGGALLGLRRKQK